MYYVKILSVAKITLDQELMNNWWNDNDGETRVIWGRGAEPLPANATLSVTDPMWTALGLNLGLDGERPVIIMA